MTGGQDSRATAGRQSIPHAIAEMHAKADGERKARPSGAGDGLKIFSTGNSSTVRFKKTVPMDCPALRSALTTISDLVDRASQATLNAYFVGELQKSIEVLESWPRSDPAFGRARELVTSVYASGILAKPSKRPTLPEQILSECHFLSTYLDALP
jgi:hypothetical protein